jgi:hypothetical protein
LDNGQVLTGTASNTTANASITPQYNINDGALVGTVQANAKVACVSYSNTCVGMAGLVQAAADPWSLWYPRLRPPVDIWHGTFAVASAVRFRKTLSQIGGRVGSRQPQGWAS